MNKRIFSTDEKKSKKLDTKNREKRDLPDEKEIRRLSWMILMDRTRRARF
ncbi:hypothetical protein GWO43_12725 [candidate division KSB1 bacterium]|nr:hypothetical protein [candidate division KSB1 bacterium]NIR71287.1 hypothetical protein [candidate division KSB1 bacterium]NIS24816.1 hypothetical protein [candidate division KSB1 bacterium]NIT71723.1 hypothetical protein [candidate division KSB1 bacterium]NIU25452.1 hypothetical protein [candidate division KSB1 bacterium]